MSSTLLTQTETTNTATDDTWTITSTISWHIAETAKIMNTPTTLMQDDHIFSTAIKDTTTTTTSTVEKSRLNVADLSASLQRFGIVDYLVFIIMLLVCALIGFYFGFIERKQKQKSTSNRRDSEALNYLVGGRKMKVIPVSISLVASFISGISLLGTSTEVYVYGTQYAFILVTTIFSGIISWYVFLPVFCNLQLTSTYEYLEKRFSRRMQIFGSVLFVCKAIIWLPLAVYMPALVLNQISGFDVHVLTPVLMLVCTFYTTLGGIKGVIWTDVIQLLITLSAVFVLLFKGTMDLGGFNVVLERGFKGGRINFPELTLDPTVRMSILSVFFGGTFLKLQNFAINQTFVQRFMSLPNKKDIKKCIIFTTAGVTSVYCCCYYVGLVTYAAFYDCDPISTGLVKKKDQIIPLLVMEVLGSFPGMTGLFVSGVLSAALSAISTLLNSLSAVILTTFIKPLLKEDTSERFTGIAMRLVVVVFGLSSIGLVYVVEHLGLIMQLSMTVQSALYGPMLGLFTVGVTMPWINDSSVLFGAIVSFATMIYVCTKANIDNATGAFRYPTLPVSTVGCDYDFQTFNSTISHATDQQFSILHISFLLYTFTGALLTVIFSHLAILYYGKNHICDVDNILLSPFVVRLKQKYYGFQPEEKLKAVELEKLTN